MRDLARAMQERVLLADGAMGTMLYAAGLPPGIPPESWNRDNPDAVRAVHLAYIEAGADIILTNSLGCSRIKLDHYDLGDEAPSLCRLGSELAREAAGEDNFVFGSMGSLGQLLQPLGTLSFAEAKEAFTEQAAGLASGGVDAILVETMGDVEEARAAIQGAHEGCSLPVICTFSFDRGLRSMMGAGAKEVAALWEEGLLAIGANCGHSLEDTLAVITEMHQLLPDVPLMAKPNAGVASLGPDGRTHFNVDPEGMAAFAPRYLEQGVRIMGGCCGNTPAHVTALAAVVKNG